MQPYRKCFSLTDEVIHQKCRCLAVLCSEQLSLWSRVREGDFLFGQVAPIHESSPESVIKQQFYIHKLKWLLMHWKCLVPDSVQKASGDSLPPHQTESPDATDTTDGFFRHGRAAPGSVVLHEILLVHVFGCLLLLQHPESLCNIEYDQGFCLYLCLQPW